MKRKIHIAGEQEVETCNVKVEVTLQGFENFGYELDEVLNQLIKDSGSLPPRNEDIIIGRNVFSVRLRCNGNECLAEKLDKMGVLKFGTINGTCGKERG